MTPRRIRPTSQTEIFINAATLLEAERLIQSCEGCNPHEAEIPFDNILDRVSGSDPSVTDYVLEQPAKCPNCRREILEKTLAQPHRRTGVEDHGECRTRSHLINTCEHIRPRGKSCG